MKSDKLQDAINHIDDRFIEEAEDLTINTRKMTRDDTGPSDGEENTAASAPGKISWFSRHRTAVGALAACAALAVLLGGLGIHQLGKPASLTAEFNELKEELGSAPAKSASDGPVYAGAAADADGSSPIGAGVDEAAEIADEGYAREEAISPGLALDGEHEDSAVSDVLIPSSDATEAAPFVLTAGVWNDNHNWPFFTNLVNSGVIRFPSYGLDPRQRVSVAVTSETGEPIAAETVHLLDASGEILWTARTDKEGKAYLFYHEGNTPAAVSAGDVTQEISVAPSSDDKAHEEAKDAAPGQGGHVMSASSEVSLTLGQASRENAGLQVMFVIDTTGSMSDELAYLQKDFSSIASEAADGIDWSVNFYRDEGDEYVTQCHGFTKDVSEVQAQINGTYADGGGDVPEAVTRILDETITHNDGWQEDAAKLLFLVFDAPPHADDELSKLADAVKHAALLGIRIVPVVASNAERDTEVFGRALSIMTGADYVFLTNDSGVGESHLEPIIGDYDVELLHDILVRMINEAAE